VQRKIFILTEGGTNPHTAKTASCVIRYRGDEVVALLDSTQAGKTVGELLGVGGPLPVVAAVADAPEADMLLLGTAPPGGHIPLPWRRIILDAVDRGLDVISGLHDFLSDDHEFLKAAETRGVELIDVRKTDHNQIAHRLGLRNDCLRVLTVGHDCSVGKMLTAMELTAELKRRGMSAKFVATGQTGIMIEGDGCPIDHVISDFVSGAVESMILEHQHHDVLMIEGQGSLVHPSYSAVTLGLLHGAAPHAMILCYEVGRKTVTGLDHLRIPPLAKIKELNEMMAAVHGSSKVIGIAMNSSTVDQQAAERERKRVQDKFGLPVCDCVRHGSGELVEAVLRFHEQEDWREAAYPPV